MSTEELIIRATMIICGILLDEVFRRVIIPDIKRQKAERERERIIKFVNEHKDEIKAML